MVKYKEMVVTKEDVRLDELVFKEYGHLEFLEEILEENIKVILGETHLPQGVKLRLPIYKKEEQEVKRVEGAKLW